MLVAKLVPCPFERHIVGHQATQSREPLRFDLDGETARPVAVIFDGGLAPGRDVPSGHGVGLWLEDAAGDHHLERGVDHARPIGASAGGLGGPPSFIDAWAR